MPYDPNTGQYYDAGPNLGSSALGGFSSGAGLGATFGGPVGALIGGGIGALGGLISGISQKNKANNLMKSNPYPTMPIPQDVLDSQQMARNNAMTGLPSQQYANAMKNIRNQQAAQLFAATSRRSGNANIGAIGQQTGNNYADLAAKNAEAQRQNQQELYNINSQVAGYRNKAFDWNQRNRYQQTYNYAMGLLGAGNQNIVGGIDRAGATIMRSGLFNGGLGGNRATSGSYSLGTPNINSLTNGFGEQSNSDNLNEGAY